MSEAAAESVVMNIHVKTPKDKHTFQIQDNINIKDFKAMIAEKFKSDSPETLCLIFAGKIMKDHEKLNDHNVKDGMTIHLVIRAKPAANVEPPRPVNTEPSQLPFGLGGLGGISGLSGLGMDNVNFMEMQQNLQNAVLNNPSMMQQLVDSPVTQNLMSNPEIMRSLIRSNPQMEQLIERNPEINQMLNNPEAMRQTMEIVRNPAMLQELMRNQDRAMSNLESIPGGQNSLQNMYREIQEPLLNAVREQFISNPFETSSSSNNLINTPSGETAAPVPNPWQSSPSNTNNSSSATATTTTSGSTSSGPGTNLFSSPGMTSLMTQMMENPNVMQNMLNTPYTQTLLRTLSQNPELANQAIAGNSLLAGNPGLQENIRAMMPQMLNQMQNPAVQSLMTNPEALSALMQIQNGMTRLQAAAPDFYTSMNVSSFGPGFGGTSNTTEPARTPGNSDTSAFSSLMNQMVLGMAEQGHNRVPEERFRIQLETLAGMGFIDRQANIEALIATHGDVNAAIDRLLNRPSGQSN